MVTGSGHEDFLPLQLGINEATIRQDVRHQDEQEMGQAQLEL